MDKIKNNWKIRETHTHCDTTSKKIKQIIRKHKNITNSLKKCLKKIKLSNIFF